MEFVRRWIKYYLRVAFRLDHFGSMSSALRHENQSFSPRDVKALNDLLADLVGQGIPVSNETTAEEVVRIAVWNLRRFDRAFRNRTNNVCGCRIGAKELKVDFNCLWDDVRDFFRATATVLDCPVNSFLDFRPVGRAGKLLDNPGVAQRTKSGIALAKLRDAGKHITCLECRRIGDIVIALDQRPSWCLAHIDEDFNILCPALGKSHKQLPSERSVEKDAPKIG